MKGLWSWYLPLGSVHRRWSGLFLFSTILLVLGTAPAILATLVALTFLGVPGQLLAQTVEGTDPRPNILVFISDDMGWGQPGFNGGTQVPTPNMDRIANEGVKLTQFYVHPVCSPTRASLLTGRYPWKNGMEGRVGWVSSWGMLVDERTIAEALRDAGYATWMVGKWHLGQWRREHLPRQRGFDHFYGLYSALIDSYIHDRSGIFDWHRNGRPVVESGYSTFLLADEAIRLIERHDGSHPFFLYLPFNAPHEPHAAPSRFISHYNNQSNPLQRAMVEAMDVAMGRVMDALDRKGVLDDTLIMFLNDNGGPGSAGRNRPYRGGKEEFWEGGIRVPAALRWPARIPAGSESDALLHVVDLFPTFAGLAGADVDAGLPLDGVDAWEAVAEGAESPRTEVVHSLDVIRVGDWKLMKEGAKYLNWSAGQLRLYNIAEDPYETTNLAAVEIEPEKVAELRARLAYHAQFARDGEPVEDVPGNWPVVYGEEENAAYAAEVTKALRLREEGILGPALLRLEVSGAVVTLVYDKTLQADSVPPTDAFTLVLNPGYRSAGATAVEVSGSEVVLTLAAEVADGETVGLTYEVPDTGAIRDADGLAANGVTWASTEPPPPTFTDGTSTSRAFNETIGDAGVSTASNIGMPVAATDTGDTLTYSLEGTAAAKFGIISTSGQIQTEVGEKYDHEARSSYAVTVKVVDGHGGSNTITVTITVVNVEEPGMVTLTGTPARELRQLTAALSDPDGILSRVTWQWARSVNSTGPWTNITQAAAPQYTPGADDVNRYLRASAAPYTDGEGSGKRASRVTTTPVQAAPKVTLHLSSSQPRVGSSLTATVVSDPDGVDTVTTEWCWERSLLPIFSPADTTDADCTSATTATYTPVEDDLGHYLRATVTYTDSQGTFKREAVTTTPVQAAPKVTLHLSSSQPRVGSSLTATVVSDPDGVDTVTTGWCWERSLLPIFSPADTTDADCTLATTATYTPVEDDLGHYLRATVTYTDSQGTFKREAVTTNTVLARGGSGGGGSGGGGSGGGGSGGGGGGSGGGGGGSGPACAEDLHGNSAAQSTDIALSAVTAGAICPAADVDYFTVTAPGQGLVFVDTPRGISTHGTIWQNGTLLASGLTGGSGRSDRLGTRVQAGLVVIALQGQGGATGDYDVVVTFVPGYLENPGSNSFQSGVGVLSGWVCEAAVVEMALNGVPQEAAYGTERLDTAGVCGDTDNGFGLLFNWNLLRDGEHAVVALVDGVELGRATVTVTTLGQEFLRDVTGTCEVADFPVVGETVRVEWQQNSQNFVMTQVE